VKYAKGKGVLQDYTAAHKWFNLAASFFPASEPKLRYNAVKLRDAIAARMTPAQIAEAQRLVREWRPKNNEQTLRAVTITSMIIIGGITVSPSFLIGPHHDRQIPTLPAGCGAFLKSQSAAGKVASHPWPHAVKIVGLDKPVADGFQLLHGVIDFCGAPPQET